MLSLSATAGANDRVIEEAEEASPEHVILPATANGMMTFRACDEACVEDVEYERIQLAAGTVFKVNGRRVKYDEFRARFAAIKAAGDGIAMVRYDVATRTLVELGVATPPSR